MDDNPYRSPMYTFGPGKRQRSRWRWLWGSQPETYFNATDAFWIVVLLAAGFHSPVAFAIAVWVMVGVRFAMRFLPNREKP